MDLGSLKTGQKGVVLGISSECKGEIRQRFLDLGFIKGAEIHIQNISPLGDPIAYNIHNTLIALRSACPLGPTRNSTALSPN